MLTDAQTFILTFLKSKHVFIGVVVIAVHSPTRLSHLQNAVTLVIFKHINLVGFVLVQSIEL